MEKIPEAARSAFEDFLSRRDRGEAVDLEVFCAARPELAPGIKLLHSLHAHVGESAAPPGPTGAGAGEVLSSLQASRLERLGPGATIGPYRLLRQIGSGGMGAVFLAEQERPVRRQVALKVIKLGMDTREVVARFEAERQALALMAHPHIATVLDAGATDEGRPYFVMEHVPGVPITEYCDQHELSMAGRLTLFLQVCEGVQHAHQKGIIHRDIKPSNVLVAARGEEPAPKIIDFGVAKAVSQRLTERSVFTEIGQIIGTPEYMSPEQAEMSELDIDTRSDIYSLGVLLYELLVGALPFDPKRLRQGGYASIQRIIREEEPLKPSTRVTRQGQDSTDAARKRRTDPHTLLRLLRGDLDWITMKAMAKDRAQRYESASELAADIRRHLRHEPVLAGPPGAAYRARKLVRRHRAKLAAAAVVALLLTVISVATWRVTSSRARDERLQTSATHYREGQALALECRKLREALPLLESRWQDARNRHELWQPVWDRHDELEAWEELGRARKELPRHFLRADQALNKALETAPADSTVARDARLALEALYMERYREGERQGEIRLTPEHYKALVEALDAGTYTKELEGGRQVAFESIPPGAEVHCFRYEEHEQRLVPIPFDPARGKDDPAAGRLGKPFLVVEQVPDAGASPLQPGDRLLAVRNQPVSLPGDVAQILKGLAAGESVKARVSRSGGEVELDWIPIAASGPGAGGLDWRERLGATFAGYPLDFAAGCRVGTTEAAAPLRVDLPRGSYLFVLRRQGYRDARIPVAVPGPGDTVKVRLLAESDIPPGFVPIPAGGFPHGGDAGAFRSLEAGEHHLEDYFIGRFEVTVREYLDFVNDPEVLAATDEKGETSPTTEDVRRELQLVHPDKPDSQKVWLIPKLSSGAPRWIRRPGGGWLLPPESNWKEEWPMLDVTHLAALEHAAWRTRKETGPWRYRLPTDLEWEKAARGADRRLHVWGNYMVWSFCWSFDRQGKAPATVGASPLDESVYGVRDMAGSVNEHTTGQPVARFRYRSLRGGGWSIIDEESYRIATRNSRYPERSETQTGFRLVAEAR